MAASNELLVVHFLEPATIRHTYQDYLDPHVTVLPWFAADPFKSAEVLADVATEKPLYRVTLGEADMFGDEHDIPVFHVLPPSAVRGIHNAILRRLRHPANGPFKPSRPDYQVAGFNPHLSMRPGQPPRRRGEEFIIDTLSLVSRDKDSGEKTVIHHLELTGGR